MAAGCFMTQTDIPPALPIPLLNANLLAFAYTMGLFLPIPLYYPRLPWFTLLPTFPIQFLMAL